MTLTPTLLREYDRAAPDGDNTETATFGVGCFWGPDAQFGALDGVVRTRVGYAGGTKPDPTYHALGDHTEVFQVDFDPNVLPYADLLTRIFRNHDPHRQTGKRQYQNVVLAATADQRKAIEAFLADNSLTAEGIETRIEQLRQFTVAENYHQKHSLQARPPLVDAFKTADYDDKALRESPAAAKLNGLAAGHDLPDGDNLAAVVGGTIRR